MNVIDPLLDLRRVSVWYGRQVVLRSVDFQLMPGEAVALVGPNGAGKTTILRVLATLLRPNRGSYTAFGLDPWAARGEVCERLGVLAHQPYLYPELSCRENLRFFGRMFKLSEAERRIESVLADVGLADRSDQQAGSLSRGLLQRLNLARALLHRPDVLILDEPESGLDVTGRELLARLTADARLAGGGVVFATHALDLGNQLATRVVQVEQGRVAGAALEPNATQAEHLPSEVVR